MVKTRSASVDETRKACAAKTVVTSSTRRSLDVNKPRNRRSVKSGSMARRSTRTSARLKNIAEDQKVAQAQAKEEDEDEEEEEEDRQESEAKEDGNGNEDNNDEEGNEDEDEEDESEDEEEEEEEEDVGKATETPAREVPKRHIDKVHGTGIDLQLTVEPGHGVSHFDIGSTGGRRGRHRRKGKHSRRPQSLQTGCEARTGGGYYSWLDVVNAETVSGDNSNHHERKRKRTDGVDACETLAARSAAAAARGNVEEASSGIASALRSETNALYRSTAADAQREVAADTARKAPETAGRKWFDMEAPEMTDAVRQDLLLLRNRNFIDAKRFYKGAKNEHKKELPKFFQMGTIVEAPHEFVSGRLSKKERKATIMDELLSDDRLRGYTRKTFLQIQKKKSSGGKRWHKNNMNRRKPTWARK